MLLIDKYLSNYLFKEIHSIEINASADVIYSLMREVDFERSIVFRMLFRLRGMPKGMNSIQGFIDNGLVELEQLQNRELVLGVIASPVRGGIKKYPPQDFISFKEQGYAKGVTNYLLIPIDRNKTRFITETRFVCYGAMAKTLLILYWVLIRPFSGIVRNVMLKQIKRQVENQL